MLSHEEVQKRLSACENLSEIKRKTGLAYDTLWRIKTGRDNAVSYRVIKALSDHFETETSTNV